MLDEPMPYLSAGLMKLASQPSSRAACGAGRIAIGQPADVHEPKSLNGRQREIVDDGDNVVTTPNRRHPRTEPGRFVVPGRWKVAPWVHLSRVRQFVVGKRSVSVAGRLVTNLPVVAALQVEDPASFNGYPQMILDCQDCLGLGIDVGKYRPGALQ